MQWNNIEKVIFNMYWMVNKVNEYISVDIIHAFLETKEVNMQKIYLIANKWK